MSNANTKKIMNNTTDNNAHGTPLHRLARLLGCRQVRLDYNHEYGIQQRSGWSVALDGHYVVRLEPSLLRALWVAWRYTRNREPNGKDMP